MAEVDIIAILVFMLFAIKQDSIGLLLGSEDVIGIESMRSRIESFQEVKQADAFMPTKLACPQEWILKGIDKKLAQSALDTKKSRNY